MDKSTMLMDYEDFRDTEHLQESISSEELKHNIEFIKENAKLDNKPISLFTNSASEESQNVDEDEYTEKNVTYIGQTKKIKLENTNNGLRSIFYKKNPVPIDSFYTDIDEWHGVVDSIDAMAGKFKVLFSDEHGETKYIAEFDMVDMQFPSDLDLLKVGANIIWIFGHETKLIKVDDKYKLGPRTNVSRLKIRRTKILTKKQVKEAEEDAERWTEFFRRCKSED